MYRIGGRLCGIFFAYKQVCVLLFLSLLAQRERNSQHPTNDFHRSGRNE